VFELLVINFSSSVRHQQVLSFSILSVGQNFTAVAALIQFYGELLPAVWYKIRITVSKIVRLDQWY